jgi:hypothetical protein
MQTILYRYGANVGEIGAGSRAQRATHPQAGAATHASTKRPLRSGVLEGNSGAPQQM